MNKEIASYIKGFDDEIRAILIKIRDLVVMKAPNAQEKISYGIPSFHNNGIIIYYAAFKNHFSIFPPIKGDAKLLADVAHYANDKGNLLFKYNKPIPWELIERVIERLILENTMRKADKA